MQSAADLFGSDSEPELNEAQHAPRSTSSGSGTPPNASDLLSSGKEKVPRLQLGQASGVGGTTLNASDLLSSSDDRSPRSRLGQASGVGGGAGAAQAGPPLSYVALITTPSLLRPIHHNRASHSQQLNTHAVETNNHTTQQVAAETNQLLQWRSAGAAGVAAAAAAVACAAVAVAAVACTAVAACICSTLRIFTCLLS